MPHRKGTPDYRVLAKHLLRISDTGKNSEMLAKQPNDRLLAIAALIETCFGPDSAEAIARDLMTELDEFDVADPDNSAVTPGLAEREDFVAELLRKEFDSDAI